MPEKYIRAHILFSWVLEGDILRLLPPLAGSVHTARNDPGPAIEMRTHLITSDSQSVAPKMNI